MVPKRIPRPFAPTFGTFAPLTPQFFWGVDPDADAPGVPKGSPNGQKKKKKKNVQNRGKVEKTTTNNYPFLIFFSKWVKRSSKWRKMAPQRIPRPFAPAHFRDILPYSLLGLSMPLGSAPNWYRNGQKWSKHGVEFDFLIFFQSQMGQSGLQMA